MRSDHGGDPSRMSPAAGAMASGPMRSLMPHSQTMRRAMPAA